MNRALRKRKDSAISFTVRSSIGYVQPLLCGCLSCPAQLNSQIPPHIIKTVHHHNIHAISLTFPRQVA